jgi:hypothetical protein
MPEKHVWYNECEQEVIKATENLDKFVQRVSLMQVQYHITQLNAQYYSYRVRFLRDMLALIARLPCTCALCQPNEPVQ